MHEHRHEHHEHEHGHHGYRPDYGYHHRHPHKSMFGAGLLGFALGALAGVFLAPRSGRETREKAVNWMNNMSEELNRRVNNVQDMSALKYNALVDEIAYKYRKMRGIKQNEVDDFVADLKMRWDRVKDEWRNGPEEYY